MVVRIPGNPQVIKTNRIFLYFGSSLHASQPRKKKLHNDKKEKKAYLRPPLPLQLHQPNHGRNPPHINLQLHTNRPNTPLEHDNASKDLLPQVLTQHRLADKVRVQGERPLGQLTRVRGVRAQFLQIGHVFVFSRFVGFQSSALVAEPFEHLASESCLGGRCGGESAAGGM